MPAAAQQVVELSIGGMTCASCAARVAKKLTKLDGVTATVNFATEKARVTFADTVSAGDLIATVERTGYTAALPVPPPEEKQPAEAGAGAAGAAADGDDETAALRRRLGVSLLLAVPVVVLAMVPAWQFRSWQWLSLTLAAPVAVWGAWPLHRAALVNARHGGLTARPVNRQPRTAAVSYPPPGGRCQEASCGWLSRLPSGVALAVGPRCGRLECPEGEGGNHGASAAPSAR